MVRQISSSKSWRPGEILASFAFVASVWVALFNLLYSEYRGSGEIFVIGPYHCNVIDIAIFFGLIAFVFVPKGRLFALGTNGRILWIPLIAKLSITIMILTDLSDWARGLYLDFFRANYAQRSTMFLLVVGGTLIWMRPGYRILTSFAPLFVSGSIGLMIIYVLRSLYGSNYGVDIHSSEYVEFLYGDKRLITADGATFLGCAGIYFLDRSVENVRSAKNILFGIFSIATIILEISSRQRTATLATSLAIVIYFTAAPRLIARVPWLVRISIIVIFFAAIGTFFVMGPDRIVDLMPETFRAAATKTATLDVRHKLWAAALDRFGNWGVVTHLIGLEAGRPYLIFIDGEEWKAQMHSVYFGTLLQSGILGLCALGVLVMNSLVSVLMALARRRAANDAGISPQVGLAWLSIMLIYGYSYEWHNMLCLFAFAPMAAWSELGRTAVKTAQRPAVPGQRPRPRPRVRAPRPTSPDIGVLGYVDA